jgi:WD40 repeat protein
MFRKPLWSNISTNYSTFKEVASHPELRVQMVADLGNVQGVGVFFSPDGNRILIGEEWRYDEATTESFSHYKLYDKQGNLIADLGEAKWGYLTSDGVVLVAMSGSTPLENLGISAASWKLSFWSLDGKFVKDENGCCGTFPELIFDPTHSKFVTFRGYYGLGVGKQEEYLWSSNGQQIAVLSLPNGEAIEGASFSSDGKLIAVSAEASTWLLDETGYPLHMLSIPDDQHSNAEIYFSPDGKHLAVSDDFNHTEIWTIDGQLITTLGDVQAFAYSLDGHYLIGEKHVNDDDDEILLFDIQNNFTPKSIITYKRLYGIHFDSNGERIVTFGCTDGQWWESGFFCRGGTATVWDKDGNPITELKGLAEVTEAGFLPNSDSTIVAGCNGIIDNTFIFPSYDCLSRSLRLHDKKGNTTAILREEIGDFWISPDGKSFITTSQRYSGKAKLWSLLP